MSTMNRSPPPPNYTESVLTGTGAGTVPSASITTSPAATQQFTEQQPHTVEHSPSIYQQPDAGANENSPLMSIPGEIRPEIMPSDYLVLSIVVAVVCFWLNPFSLFCSIPAIMQANMAFEEKHKGELTKAKMHGKLAVYLIVACALWALFSSVLITGLVTGLIA